MEIEDKKRLQANRRSIVENVRVKDVKDHLYEAGILSNEDLEEVSLSSITQTERTRRLLAILPRRGPKAFPEFLNSLKEEYEYLVTQILETDISLVTLAEDDIDYREKLNTLQTQLWQQTQLIVEFQKEITSLKSTVEEQRMRENEFVEKMSTKGLRPEMLAFMQYNEKSWEEPDSGGGRVGDGVKVTSGMLRPHSDPQVIRETAIELGLDVMHYMSNPKRARPAKSPYVINMRRVVADLLLQHKQLFQDIIQGLNVNEMNGYETLLRIADEIFRGQINWGRIGVWYTFGASVGIHCEEHNMPEVAKWIAEFTGIYVSQNLSEWIGKNDGWNGLNKFVADKERDCAGGSQSHTPEGGAGGLGLTLGALGLVGIGLGAYAAFKSS